MTTEMIRGNNMKKTLLVLLTLTLVALFAVGCTTKDVEPTDTEATGTEDSYKDGVYFAQEDVFSEETGYKYFVVVTVADGEITDADWGGTNVQPLGNKKTLSQDGKYGMEWHTQADAAEKWLIENQDPTKMTYTDDEGHTDVLTTDAGTAVSIHVVEFYELAKKALDSEPVAEGTYTTPADYVAMSELSADEKGWEYKADFIVANGTIVSTNFNSVFTGELTDETTKYFGVDEDGKPDATNALSKVELEEDYGMAWHEQAAKANAFVVENQGLTVEYKDDEGHSDSIAGVSISINQFDELFKAALGK